MTVRPESDQVVALERDLRPRRCPLVAQTIRLVRSAPPVAQATVLARRKAGESRLIAAQYEVQAHQPRAASR